MKNYYSAIEKNIFISYAREDQDIALRLYSDFMSAGLKPWIDKENLLPGQNWKQTITKAIAESSYFIALLSTNSVSKKGYIQKELKIAFDVWSELPPSTIFIIPVRIEDCEPLYDELLHLHWADLFPSYEKGLEKILQVLQPEKENTNHQGIQEKSREDSIKSMDFGDAPNIGNFYGRRDELALLEKIIVEDNCQVIGIVGMGGIGKTALAVKLTQNIENKFDYVLWRSFINAPPVEEIVQDVLRFLSSNNSLELPSNFDEQLELMLDYLKTNKCLIIFDSMEVMMKGGELAGNYREGYELYKQMFTSLAESPHNSCIVFTSRVKPLELSNSKRTNLSVRIMDLDGLSVLASKEIIDEYSLAGSADEIKKVVSLYSGNPLALKLVAATIQDWYDGNIGQFIKEPQPAVSLDSVLDNQFNQLNDTEKEVVYRIGIHRDSLPLSKLLNDTKSTKNKNQILESIQSLSRKSMIAEDENGFSLPSVLIEYINQRLVEKIVT
jgi:hypothetical protein